MLGLVFARMVFNAAVTNKDDHPRSHALLRSGKSWRLSPAYDLVPAPLVSLERRDLALTVVTWLLRLASVDKKCFDLAQTLDFNEASGFELKVVANECGGIGRDVDSAR